MRILLALLPTVAFALFAPSAAAAAKAAPIDSVPLVWRPSASAAVPPIDAAPFEKVRIRVAPFADARGVEAGQLGTRDGSAPVTTPDDVATFATDRILAALEEEGLTAVDDRFLERIGADLVERPGGVVTRVAGRLLTMRVEIGKELETEVQLELTVTVAAKKDEPAKPALFVGTATGRSGRSARSYEVGDAQEALSDALGEAVAQLLRTESFVKALRGER
jgi:hypothetical protein